MTDDNKDQMRGKEMLVAYYDVDYVKNPKGSNYWRNRYASLNPPRACFLFLHVLLVCPLITGFREMFNCRHPHFSLRRVTGKTKRSHLPG